MIFKKFTIEKPFILWRKNIIRKSRGIVPLERRVWLGISGTRVHSEHRRWKLSASLLIRGALYTYMPISYYQHTSTPYTMDKHCKCTIYTIYVYANSFAIVFWDVFAIFFLTFCGNWHYKVEFYFKRNTLSIINTFGIIANAPLHICFKESSQLSSWKKW